MSKWTAAEIPDQAGRTAVVTGANSGLGLVTALELARAGARVVLTARDQTKASSARDQIRAEVPTAELDLRVLDLADLGSVREFATAVTGDHPSLDLLVNNAGVMMPPRSETADGFELQFGTNHLGHFALTGLLLDALTNGSQSRVVTVSSLEHRPGKIDFDDLGSEHSYSPRGNYQRSKFANAVFGLELDRRLRASGSPVISVLAHPGYSDTNLQRTGPTGAMRAVLEVGNRLLAQGADKGALPQLYAATAPEVEGGEFYGPDGFQQMRGSPKRVHPVRRAEDEETAKRLWQVSEELTGVTYLERVTGVYAQLGRVGLPAPIAQLAAREWDAIVVGGGHNGLTAAAYLAKAGKRVLVLERREQLGGAATLERPFADERFVVSPCAYVVGLLDQVVIDELDLARHGYRVTPADPNLWCPFADGTSYAGFIDGARTTEYLRDQGFADSDIEGVRNFNAVFDRIRDLLRGGGDDLWLRASPERDEIEARLGGDPELVGVVFEESIASMLDRYVTDQRLKDAIACQGTIGTFAGPRDAGTASIRLMHHQGDLLGLGSVWGYVDGGLGRVSFSIADAALEAGAVIAAGVPVAAIRPGEGVELESGETVTAPIVVCNADPKRLLGMLEAGGSEIPDSYRARLRDWDVSSPVLKLNVALDRFPTFSAAPAGLDPHRAMVSITDGVDAAQAAVESARRGEPAIGFCELYFQSAYDDSVVPPGKQVMSVFCQYVPYELAQGDWDSRRDEIAAMAIDAIEVHAPDVRQCIDEIQAMGPPDIEERIGLSGGHIFQGQALPEQMWDRRLAARAPIEGLYLCGAATHPGGSVIALNGRTAAREALAD